MYSNELISYYRQYIMNFVEDNDLPIFSDILDIFLFEGNAISIDQLAKYLGSKKYDLKQTLIRSYKKNKDYFIEQPYRSRYKENIFLTIDCVKRLCLRSNTPNAERVRDYFIVAEELYKDYFVRSLEYKLGLDPDDMIGGENTNFPIGQCIKSKFLQNMMVHMILFIK